MICMLGYVWTIWYTHLLKISKIAKYVIFLHLKIAFLIIR